MRKKTFLYLALVDLRMGRDGGVRAKVDGEVLFSALLPRSGRWPGDKREA